MEDLKRIEALLNKYFNGETSTAEESELRDFFTREDVPDHLFAEAELFGFFRKQKTGGMSVGLQSRLENMIDGQEVRPVSIISRWRYYWISGAAALILLMLALFLDSQIRKRPSLRATGDTYEDPYLAYAEAKRVLYYVSEKMNTGTKPLRNLEKIETGKQFMQPVFSIGTGLQKLEYFSTIEKTKELISK
jgi:hypothetical protein